VIWTKDAVILLENGSKRFVHGVKLPDFAGNVVSSLQIHIHLSTS
jgi:hypothetical protein